MSDIMERTGLSPSSDTGGAPPELYLEPHWYACRTRSRAETKLDRLLPKLGFETYLPLVEVDRHWSDRVRRVSFPLFPGHLFVRFKLNQIGDLLRQPYVATVARPSGYPTPVLSDEIASVRRMVAGIHATGRVPYLEDYLTPGVEVRVVKGPFRGMKGVLLEKKGGCRVAIRIPALRQASSVDVERTTVRPV